MSIETTHRDALGTIGFIAAIVAAHGNCPRAWMKTWMKTQHRWRTQALHGSLWVCAVAPVAAGAVGGMTQQPRTQPMTAAAQAAYEHVVSTRDNASAPFIVIDKTAAQLWVFDARGDPRGTTPVLLGAARGDHSVPGIGQREVAQILPHERTTPAGRFVGERGRNLDGEDIIWVDYDAAVSMHRVRATKRSERRLERLASSTPRDNRISYGCINVPALFYDRWLAPIVMTARPVVYVLPEAREGRAVASSRAAR
jgi:hypothetical protein